MPKLKKASAKAVDVKSIKRQANKTNKKDQGATLHQVLSTSLSQLNEYWKKQSDASKKQMDSARAELKKAQDKLKTLKTEKTSTKVSGKAKNAKQSDKAQLLFVKQQQTLAQAKLSLVEAKQQQQQAQLQAKKYAELSKAVTGLEKDAAKQIAQINKAAKEEAKAVSAKPAAKQAKAKTTKAAATKTTKEKATVAATKPKKAATKAKAKKTILKPKSARKTKADTLVESTEEMMDIFEEKPDFSNTTEQREFEEQANYEDEVDAELDEMNEELAEEEYDEFND